MKATTARLTLNALPTLAQKQTLAYPLATASGKTTPLLIRTNLTLDALLFIGTHWQKRTQSHTQASLIHFINHRANLGYSASQPLDQLSPSHIRNCPGISYAQLTRFKAKLQGRTSTYPPRALVFGSAFHTALLEPSHLHLPDYNLRPSELRTLQRMTEAVTLHPEANALLRSAQCEHTVQWLDPVTRSPCKAKLDLLLDSGNIADLKSTSAPNRSAFLASLDRYDYDLQAHFYLNSIKGARRFYFIGVQKRPPYQVFVESFYCNTLFMRKGKKKLRFLMKKLVGISG